MSRNAAKTQRHKIDGSLIHDGNLQSGWHPARAQRADIGDEVRVKPEEMCLIHAGESPP